jgi:hypothetical protein
VKKNSVRNAINFSATLFLHALPTLRPRVFLISFGVAILCTGAMFSPIGQVVFAESGNPLKQTQVQTDVQRLKGQWVRPDGGYILELWDIKKDGKVSAAYFNPRPINVFRTEWNRKQGVITVFVELRDVNYPGSTYTLQFDPKSDRLKGTYFQAVERQTFNIEFVRVKSKKEGQQ